MADLLEGKLVRLTFCDKEKDADLVARWNTDSDYIRLCDIGPSYLYSVKQIKEWLESENGGEESNFAIHTLADDKMIGTIGFGDFNWMAGTAWVGIGIGERDYWGKGYGTDAMQVILRYAFTELNLHRVNLTVFEFNKRAIRSYEKCGFKYEGVQREFIYKDDQRWDILNMGILQSEWKAMQV